jgi:2'-5' RNA ligase
VRLFLALPLSHAGRAALAGLQAALRPGCRGWKWVDPASIHLTVRFLGDVFPDDAAHQGAGWRAAARGIGPISYRLEGLGVFPGRARPRVLWVGITELTSGGRLARLAAHVEAAARDAGFPPENRAFHPHLTLARAKQDARPDPPPDGATVEPAESTCTELILFRSELRPEGARYTPLEAYALGTGRECS